MTPIELIHRVKQAGLRLEIASENRLKVDGDRSIQEQFLPLLKEQKTAILEVLKTGHFDSKKAPDFHPKNVAKNAPIERKNPALLIPFEPPYLLHYYDPNLGFTQKLPYTQTPAFNSEISQARAFLKQLYLRGVDIEITPEKGLKFVAMPNEPTQEDLKEASRLQHGIRYQIDNPVDLYAGDLVGKCEIGVRLDDRHSCLECANLTPSNSCRQVVRGGKFVAWIDSQCLEKKHRCERFRVKAVRH